MPTFSKLWCHDNLSLEYNPVPIPTITTTLLCRKYCILWALPYISHFLGIIYFCCVSHGFNSFHLRLQTETMIPSQVNKHDSEHCGKLNTRESKDTLELAYNAFSIGIIDFLGTFYCAPYPGIDNYFFTEVFTLFSESGEKLIGYVPVPFSHTSISLCQSIC